jgi:cytosine/creatinine deaminase
MQIPHTDHYWLLNANVPTPLLANKQLRSSDEFTCVHLEIHSGKIHCITPAAMVPTEPIATLDTNQKLDPNKTLDLNKKQVWCGLIDSHTHLDKGHIWQRSPNITATFDDALATVQRDRQQYWTSEDVYRRMEFGLKCSYAHGTTAIRTHIDAIDEQAAISFGAFQQLKAKWRDRLTLQAVCLVSLDYFLTPAGEQLADLVADVGGILGGVGWMNPALDQQLTRVFELAKERHLDLDFHADENDDPDSQVLHHIAKTALEQDFQRQIIVGHCCSLSMQAIAQVNQTMDLIQQSNIGIVSLPMCNLYLQGRSALHQTPQWRGITRIHELAQAGIPVAIASDNCRDPFYGFGDHDGLEVFTQAVRIAHLDAPYGRWCEAIATTPADLMGLPHLGRIDVGLSADLIIFRARNYSELLSRPQSDRVVIRAGKAIDTTLPDYAELDDW